MLCCVCCVFVLCVYVVCCVLSGRRLYDELIARPEDSECGLSEYDF